MVLRGHSDGGGMVGGRYEHVSLGEDRRCKGYLVAILVVRSSKDLMNVAN